MMPVGGRWLLALASGRAFLVGLDGADYLSGVEGI